MASLTIANGELAGRQIELPEGKFVIGRSSSASLTLDESAVSGEHCALIKRGDRYALQDLDSTNGTRLNGAPIREALLKSGDRLAVGDTEMMFEDGTVAPGQTVSSPAFSARKTTRWRGVVVIVLIGALTVLAAGWFLMKLFGS
jgi:pSer/pThr/pTyr-binding forkhead associated (FHA) protein